MKLSKNTINKFNRKIERFAEDRLTEKTWDKISAIKLYAAIITRALEDFHNGTEKQRLDVRRYLASQAFDDHCMMLFLNSSTMLGAFSNSVAQ